MNSASFDKLVSSCEEADRIRRGMVKPGRQFDLGDVDVQAIRRKTGLSRSQFALLIGVGIRTLQNWEQDRRSPQGPALALLNVFKNDPKHDVHALHG